MASRIDSYFIGVDVGTSSVRAALVTSAGHLVCSASSAITIWEPEPNFYEQSSADIWQACCTVVRVRRSVFNSFIGASEGDHRHLEKCIALSDVYE